MPVRESLKIDSRRNVRFGLKSTAGIPAVAGPLWVSGVFNPCDFPEWTALKLEAWDTFQILKKDSSQYE